MRKSFFDEPSSQEDLETRVTSVDPFERWSAAVELSQKSEAWAIQLLWTLRVDPDENTRTAADAGLRGKSPGELARVIGDSSPNSDLNSSQNRSYSEWKIRPLPDLDETTVAIFETVVLDILGTEGPTPGSRLYRLIGSSINPNNKFGLSKHRLKKLLKSLVERNAVARNDYMPASDELETANYFLANHVNVVVRPRGTRALNEIPVSEIRELLNNDPRASRRSRDSDAQFRVIANAYSIPSNEFHIVGALLEKEWFGLFSKAPE
jgi:hypothetical protein